MGPYKVKELYRTFDLQVSNSGRWEAYSVEHNHKIFAETYLEVIKKIDKRHLELRKS